MRRGGRRRKQLLDIHGKIRYWNFEGEALDRTVWRTHCGSGYGMDLSLERMRNE